MIYDTLLIDLDGTVLDFEANQEQALTKLFLNRGIVLTRDVIMDRIWDSDFDRENRTVDVHIRTLRAKLGAAGAYIETVRGMGYKIGDEA